MAFPSWFSFAFLKEFIPLSFERTGFPYDITLFDEMKYMK